jgi:hypothetical protein
MSACEKNSDSQVKSGQGQSDTPVKTSFTFKPSETLKMAFAAMKKGDFESFKKYHLKSIHDKLNPQDFEKNYQFMRLQDPEITILSEDVTGDSAEITYSVALEIDGVKAEEKDKCSLKYHLGKWYISSH